MQNRQGGILRPYASVLSEIFRFIDLFIVYASLYAVTLIHEVTFSDNYTLSGLSAVLCFLLMSQIVGLYGTWRVAGIDQELRRLMLVWAGVVFMLLLLAYSTKVSATYSRRVFLTWILLTPVLLGILRILLRLVLRHLRVAGRNMRSAAIAGRGELADSIKHKIEASPWFGLKLVGIYNDGENPDDKKTEGNLQELINRARNREIDVIFLVISMEHQDQVELLTTELADTTVSLYYIPNLFMADLLHASWGYIEDIPYLSLRESPFYGVDGTFKRMEDIVLASLILVIIAIPMAAIAVIVKLGSHGPVLFRQRRYGLDGSEFEVWKFRTMSVMQDGDHVPQASEHDPRLTPNGAILRKTSLDELPQFINVLMGSMSIVGPRPHAVAHNEEYRKLIYGYMLRHKVKPGITGWAQVNGWRGETQTLDKMENRVKHDMWYIQNWSIWLDLKIILLTIIHGFTGKNAY